MNQTIKYKSDNGYMGVLYGNSSLAMYDKDGKEVMHTGFRNINTFEELKELVNEYPDFLEKMEKIIEEKGWK